MTMRFKLPPGGDVPPAVAARRLGLSLEQFQDALPDLQRRTPPFPSPDPTTGNFDLDAIDRWNGSKGAFTGYVYFVRCGDFIKIGFSSNPRERLNSIRAAMPLEVEFLLAFACKAKAEGNLHRKFAHLRHRNEWFRAGADLLAYIEWLRTESQEILFKMDGAR